MVAARLHAEPIMALSDTQLVVLTVACQRPDRSVYPLTTKLPGGAAAKVLTSLLSKSLIKEVQAKREDTVWREDRKRGRLTLRATPAALKALGIDEAPGEGETETADAEAKPARSGKSSKGKPKARGTRADSKQAKLIAMLKTTKGATIDEIVNAFDWQPHTVRGAIAGASRRSSASASPRKRSRVAGESTASLADPDVATALPGFTIRRRFAVHAPAASSRTRGARNTTAAARRR